MTMQFVEPSCPQAVWKMVKFIQCTREVESALLGREGLHSALAGQCPQPSIVLTDSVLPPMIAGGGHSHLCPIF